MACNEGFPEGWTFTLRMAGEFEPGERRGGEEPSQPSRLRCTLWINIDHNAEHP